MTRRKAILTTLGALVAPVLPAAPNVVYPSPRRFYTWIAYGRLFVIEDPPKCEQLFEMRKRMEVSRGWTRAIMDQINRSLSGLMCRTDQDFIEQYAKSDPIRQHGKIPSTLDEWKEVATMGNWTTQPPQTERL